MQHLITRIARILRSPRGALGLFVALVLGTRLWRWHPGALGRRGRRIGRDRRRSNGFCAPGCRRRHLLGNVIPDEARAGWERGHVSGSEHYHTRSNPLAPRAKASDIVVVLDRSGSMAADNRLPYAKEAVRRLVRQLQADDRFALITFDSVAVVDTELTPVTDAVRERICGGLMPSIPGPRRISVTAC